MINKLKPIFNLFICLSCMWTINSCKRDGQANGTDKELYEMAQSTSGFTWFKNSSSLLDKSSGSGHSFPFLRTRYNSIAASKLDSDGNIMADAIFPEG